MEFRITIPDDKADHVVDALAAEWGYQEVVDGGGQVPTKAVFARNYIVQMVKDTVRRYDQKVYVEDARRNTPDPF